MIKKIIKIILVIICMITIYFFSNQGIDDSLSTSDSVIEQLYTIINKDATAEEKNQVVEDYSYIVRKLAHFTIYFILGLCVISCLSEYDIKHIIIYSFCFCFLYACTDELHQITSSGRTPLLSDVLIDSFGSLLSILLYCRFILKNKFIFNKNNL